MKAPDLEVATCDAIRHWSRLVELAEFADERHGFADSDCGFGVTYPGDLDEYDRAVDGINIPAGFVQVYGCWGPPDGYEVLVPEVTYLDLLAKMLWSAGYAAEADGVRSLAEQIPDEPGAAMDMPD